MHVQKDMIHLNLEVHNDYTHAYCTHACIYSHTLTLKAAYDKKTITDDDLNAAIERLFTYR